MNLPAFIPSKEKVVIDTEDLCRNNGTVLNNGAIDNEGNIINTGNIINNNSLSSVGSITNNGLIENNEDFVNDGSIINRGLLKNNQFFNLNDSLVNNGSVENNGFIKNTADLVQNNGLFRNNGEIKIVNEFNNDGEIRSPGLFTIAPGGSLSGSGTFSGSPLKIKKGSLVPERFTVNTDLLLTNSGNLLFANLSDASALNITGDADLDGGNIIFGDIDNGDLSNLDFGSFTLLDLTDGTLSIKSKVLNAAVAKVNAFDIEGEKDYEIVQQDNDLILTVEECFLTGTRILTEQGYKKVEELAIGDMVQTADGKLESVKWIGYQTRLPNQIRNPLRGYPILFKAGSLGNNLPEQDLYTSPDHAMLVDGLLINAGALVNDISIIKTEPTEAFVYYHIELANHSLLLAEGTAAESFYPNRKNRSAYDNGAQYDELYPYANSKLMLCPMDYPRISSKHKIPRYVSQKLMQTAEELCNKKALAIA